MKQKPCSLKIINKIDKFIVTLNKKLPISRIRDSLLMIRKMIIKTYHK